MKLIKLLDTSHNRDNFDCGSEALNRYLQQTARQHNTKGISRTFVLIDSEQPQTIIGFFTLALCEVHATQLPNKWSKKYSATIAGVKLARLAVAKTYQRQGIGEILMVEAMKRALIIADNAGVIGLFVDAKDEAAKEYYHRYDFVSLEDNPLKMFLPLATIREII
ncbi:GCN5-related N-acetyltransferase [Stanieria cyanosphaera PCC 7437]|uniref:GCN5-related N-acetyltransferase n=1 Tax=Stanieria cyanosphaera (strain ATCC 29371 / PCC 7437) TaxID=111780 RepID=K9XQP5_STAC7|nr:GNAT family N-acetyltransferase [Stanieria cyanosphaera]AFZ34843.1 GCN5-related N-acetyltransferase [Stanieria cyanosphaera PCC 7437]